MTTPKPVAIAWFRRDLRLHDNPALVAALDCVAGGAIVPLFVLDPALLGGPAAGANRTWFVIESVRALAATLAARGAELLVRHGDPRVVVPAVAAEVAARDVFAARDVSPYARRRDAAVAAVLADDGRRLHLLRGQLVVEPDALVTADGRPYTVFTPWFRRWREVDRRSVLAAPADLPGLRRSIAGDPLPAPGELQPTADRALLPRPGEAAARERLDAWADSARPGRYGMDRNQLAVDGTSRLSADLKAGLLSPVEVLARTGRPGSHRVAAATTPAAGARAAGGPATAGPSGAPAPAGPSGAGAATREGGPAPVAAGQPADGPAAFTAEIAWRDFFAQVLWHHPQVIGGAFRPDFDRLAWRADPDALAAWQDGRTGYPVVDAAMRQLRSSGWMHNRARMIAASFLSKDLLLDWREGERHFLRHLVDGDPAANNGGWQWTAGTGTDASPFFRVFNPVTQGSRFDPDGAYVRRWVPELARVPNAFVHSPWTMPPDVQEAAGCRIGRDYPAPLVDHVVARARALAAFGAMGAD